MPARSAVTYTFENIAIVIDCIAAMIGPPVEAAHTKNRFQIVLISTELSRAIRESQWRHEYEFAIDRHILDENHQYGSRLQNSYSEPIRPRNRAGSVSALRNGRENQGKFVSPRAMLLSGTLALQAIPG
jgi:hypothetical protein